MTNRDDDEQRLASGWGARPPRPAKDADAVRAMRDEPGAQNPDESAGDELVDREDEENLAQGDPLSGNPPA